MGRLPTPLAIALVGRKLISWQRNIKKDKSKRIAAMLNIRRARGIVFSFAAETSSYMGISPYDA
jgi:hypothetical protein